MKYYINLVLSFIVIWRIFALSFIKNGLFLGLYFIFFRIFADKSYIEGYDENETDYSVGGVVCVRGC